MHRINATTVALLEAVAGRLARLLPQRDAPVEAPHAWVGGDSGWHTSSFELRQGLDVVELDAAPAAAAFFADTLPAAFRTPTMSRA